MRRWVATSLAVSTLTLLTGCGGGAPDRPTFTPEQRARATAERYGYAVAGRDWVRVCDELLATRLKDTIQGYGVPCPQAIAQALGDVRAPTLRVTGVTVRGDRASVRVLTAARGQAASADALGLQRDRTGSWRIVDLGT